jgi:hypothetical protein
MFYQNPDSDSDSEDSSIIVIDNHYDSDNVSTETDHEQDTDSDSDFEEFIIEPDDDEYNEIYEDDSFHVYSEKEHDHYYIGIAKRISTETLLLVNSISPYVFFQYSFRRVNEYLAKYSIIQVQNAKVHIMKLCILEDDTYSVILKTHWLRLVQRHWKKVYKERKRILKARCSLKNLFLREINGRYPDGLNRIPRLQGMMQVYSSDFLSSSNSKPE